ncbi:MAG: hypothetical protein BTN85_0731 [Candidatus Methanohalarchaeum thermophilum]|uniref:Uncharacterized protein n=1 Tax=Methanohalarchaeum thermophilum TaxID=1903181 RepID=A0A1Q6DV57_METT1|nr:MAG: hypothetical protein BTN85_0731 [Candidatus Methanohalarchaeum thermophilum]
MSNYYDKVKDKEEKLTKKVVSLLRESGFNVHRISIEENNRGPDIEATYENGDVVIEIKAFHKNKGSLTPAFEQIRDYAKKGEEKWVITTSDVNPLFIPDDIRLFRGRDILEKIDKTKLNKKDIRWVREAEIKKDPDKLEIEKEVNEKKRSSSEFLTANQLSDMDSGNLDNINLDRLATDILNQIKLGNRTIPKIAEEIETPCSIVESKVKFLIEKDILSVKN